MIRSLPTVYSESQMRVLASLPDAVTRKGRRDRAIIDLLCATGLRASEVVGLAVRDVTPTLLLVRCGKFGKQRYVPVLKATWAAIEAYLALHPAKPDEPLFRTLEGEALTRRMLHKIVTGYSRQLGLRGAGLHTTRHSAATLWLNKGVSLPRVQAGLGHESITTTAIYIRTATAALVAEFQRCLEPAPAQGGAR
jgi:integrase/recombinase XerD